MLRPYRLEYFKHALSTFYSIYITLYVLIYCKFYNLNSVNCYFLSETRDVCIIMYAYTFVCRGVEMRTYGREFSKRGNIFNPNIVNDRN